MTAPAEPAGLDRVPELVAECLATATRGVVVLALDGVSHAAGAQVLRRARVDVLRSTFPSTSTTAWLTAVTGAGAHRHGAIGMVYRRPGTDRVTHLIADRDFAFDSLADASAASAAPSLADRLVQPTETVFERAVASGARALAVGAELELLSGEWIQALVRGAELLPSPGTGPSKDPLDVVARTIRDVEAVLSAPAATPVLLWAYVNLDDHIHVAGYDERLLTALRRLDEAAERWSASGWSVLAHADHGQVPVAPDPELLEAWSRLDSDRYCAAPGGGAGRVRWLYPRPGRSAEVADRLRTALAGHADVLTPSDLARHGRLPNTAAVTERIGAVVAVATSAAFPVPDPSLAFEHGGVADDEVLVPLARWGSARDVSVP